MTRGSVNLVAGTPGIGKSTLLLQLAALLASMNVHKHCVVELIPSAVGPLSASFCIRACVDFSCRVRTWAGRLRIWGGNAESGIEYPELSIDCASNCARCLTPRFRNEMFA